MTRHNRLKFEYIGNYGGWPHCFEIRKFSNVELNGLSTVSIYDLNELIQDQDLHHLLQPALDSCEFIPTGLSLKQRIALLQLTETGDTINPV